MSKQGLAEAFGRWEAAEREKVLLERLRKAVRHYRHGYPPQ